MNRFNPEKLLHSKWTAVVPAKKRKHFIVVELLRGGEDLRVVGCILEAVIDKQRFQMELCDLKLVEHWRQGWR